MGSFAVLGGFNADAGSSPQTKRPAGDSSHPPALTLCCLPASEGAVVSADRGMAGRGSPCLPLQPPEA